MAENLLADLLTEIDKAIAAKNIDHLRASRIVELARRSANPPIAAPHRTDNPRS